MYKNTIILNPEVKFIISMDFIVLFDGLAALAFGLCAVKK